MDISELTLNQPSFVGANDLISSGMRIGDAPVVLRALPVSLEDVYANG